MTFFNKGIQKCKIELREHMVVQRERERESESKIANYELGLVGTQRASE